MKQCKSYKEFIKIIRKYTKKHWYESKKRFWWPWLEYDIYTEEQVQECRRHTKYCKGNLPLILDEFLEDRGKKIRWSFKTCGILIGIQITNEDYYYIYQKEDGKKGLASCVGKYDLVKE